ncbi:MAG: DinB family protein [Ignavibacteria bacterium]|nr:DinB family protein [Ignavibacteria bacterium]MBI3766220.1 DinB family protein [Ignavibacteriales bacterium]
MHLSDIHTLYEYNYWANSRLLGIVETLTMEQFTKDLGSSHGGIHGTLVHIMAAEEIWLKRWKGESPTILRTTAEFPTFDTMSDHWDMVEHEMMGFCHMLKSDQDIMKAVSYKDTKGTPYSQPLYQMMQHLINHSTYHRGQVVTMLRQLSVKPIGTDLIMYYRSLIQPT